MFGLGTPEIVLLVIAIVLLFGGKKIPELMRGIGKGIREFNTAKNTVENEIKEGMKQEDVKMKMEEKAPEKKDT